MPRKSGRRTSQKSASKKSSKSVASATPANGTSDQRVSSLPDESSSSVVIASDAKLPDASPVPQSGVDISPTAPEVQGVVPAQDLEQDTADNNVARSTAGTTSSQHQLKSQTSSAQHVDKVQKGKAVWIPQDDTPSHPQERSQALPPPAQSSAAEDVDMEVDTPQAVTASTSAATSGQPPDVSSYSVIRSKTIRTPFVRPQPKQQHQQWPSDIEPMVFNTSSDIPDDAAPIEPAFNPRTQTMKEYKELLRNIATAMRHAYDKHRQDVVELQTDIALPFLRNDGSGAPVQPNPSVQDVWPLPPASANSPFFANLHSVEELTAAQLHTVFKFITSKDKGPEVHIPTESYIEGVALDALINITRSFQLLRDTIENAILQIGQLSLILEQVDPWGASFAVITLWINELMHNLTAISVHRDVIQEEILPFIAEPQPQRIAVAAILRERGLSSITINTLLMRASAVSAHLTRFIRSLDALRVSQLATLGKGDPAAKNFVAECQAQSPGGFPTSIPTYMNTLKWWRDHYVSEFDSTAAREFRKLSCEKATELVKQVKPPAPTTSSDTKPKFKSGWIIPHKEPTPTVMRSEGAQPQSSSQLSVHYRSPSPPPPPAQHLSRGWEAGSHLGSRSQSRGRRKNRKRRKGTSRNWYGDVQRGRYEDSPMVQSPDSTFESPDIPPIRRRGLPPVPPQMVPRPGQPPCIFCSSKDHYSAECHVRRHLNTRVDLLVENQICSICLRRHYGECVRADGCGICGEPTHHQAICIQNAFTINDITSTAPRFYKNAAEASFIPVPPGHQQRRPHSRPRERSRPPGRRTQRGPDNTLSDSSRPSGSRGRLQRVRALGFNAIQYYIPWNFHEIYEGRYNFSGMHNFTEFSGIAYELGMYSLVRVGPYICSEWENGGLPWWLLTKNITNMRTSDNEFKKAVDKWYSVLLPLIKPLMRHNGGPVLMLQVENEYGSYKACDRRYLCEAYPIQQSPQMKCLTGYEMTFGEMLEYLGVDSARWIHGRSFEDYTQWLRDRILYYVGNESVLYTTDGNSLSMLKCGSVPYTLTTIDFGPTSDENINNSFILQRKFLPNGHGPLVNSEFYPGWLVLWGQKEASLPSPDEIVKSAEYMYNMGANINFLMIHGGTNFGFWSGAEETAPCITSYDFFAPISEAGDVTPKYLAIRTWMKSLPDWRTPPLDVPSNNPKKAFGVVEMKPVDSLSRPPKEQNCITSSSPMSFEKIGQPFGFVLYTREMDTCGYSLNITLLKDFGYVYLNKNHLGTFINSFNGHSVRSVDLKGCTSGNTLQILVENQGRQTYETINDYKGILSDVRMDNSILTNWTQCKLDIVNDYLDVKIASPQAAGRYGVYHGMFHVDTPTDTFLNTTAWGKGVAIVNGNNLGRYWASQGPQYTLYVPAAFLRAGDNSLLLLELESTHNCNDSSCFISFVDQPIYAWNTPHQ